MKSYPKDAIFFGLIFSFSENKNTDVIPDYDASAVFDSKLSNLIQHPEETSSQNH